MSLYIFSIENFVVVGRIHLLIYTEEKEKGKALFVEILLIGVDFRNGYIVVSIYKANNKNANYIKRIEKCSLKEYYLHWIIG